jgi:predicted RNA polymerase sigma factor
MERSDFEAAADEEIGDDLLALIFTCCHPLLSREARVALTLRLLGGLTTPEISRAFLAPESTVAQRLVRAKRTLRDGEVPFEAPRGAELEVRLPSVLEVIYLVFNEGYAASAGEDWIRTDLCEEALRLGRILAELAPGEPEVHGLVALMEIQASRGAARRGPDGAPVLLLDQDRGRWDPLLIVRGLRALERAEALPGPLGPYGLQAAIAALYDALAQIAPSPIVELNRAVALGMAFGPEAGLALLERIEDDPTLVRYHLLPSVRGDLLEKAGRPEEAASEFKKAATLTGNERVREFLLSRARRPAA